MEYHNEKPLRRLDDIVDMASYRYQGLTAFHNQGQDLTYSELEDRTNQVASMLSENGVNPGDRVALYIPNTLQFPESYFGAIRAGAIPVPLNLRMAEENLVYILDDSDIDHFIASPLLTYGIQREDVSVPSVVDVTEEAGVENLYIPGGLEDSIDYQEESRSMPTEFERPSLDYNDVAIQPYTSGTTGKPKGVLLTHRNLLTAVESFVATVTSPDPDECLLLVLPLFHMYGLNALMTPLMYGGGKIVLQTTPDNPKQMLELIDEHGVTSFPAVPAIFNMMYREYRENPDGYDLSSLETVNSGAAPLAEDTKNKITTDWGVVMGEGWGMTETSPAGTVRGRENAWKPAGCIGKPLENIEIKLVDPETRETRIPWDKINPRRPPPTDIDFEDEEAVTGEIAIRGPQVFKGYYNLPDKTEEVFDDEGWFYTEDIARIDEERDLWMVDRADDMIIAGGENIYPAEIENVLYDHEAIAEAAVVAAPHEIKGEAPVAFVVLEEGAEITEEELREYTLERVPTYAHPRKVFFVEELPRSGTEKVQRFKLEKDAEGRVGKLGSSEKL